MKKLLLFTTFLSIFLYSCSCSDENNASSNSNANNTSGVPSEKEGWYYSTFTADPSTMDYITVENAYDLWSAYTIESLTEYDRYGRIWPAGAESYTHSDDYMTWTFKLRKDHNWVNNKGEVYAPVTAQDYIFAQKLQLDPKNKNNTNLTAVYWVKGAEDYQAGKTTDFGTVGMKAIDDYTLEFELERRCFEFDFVVMSGGFLPLNEKFYTEIGADKFGSGAEYFLSNGGFYLSRWDRDLLIEFKKNPHYWDKDNIHIPVIQYTKSGDNNVVMEMFERKEIVGTRITGANVSKYSNDPRMTYYPTTTDFAWYAFNTKTTNPEGAVAIQNKNFRKALYHGINMIDVFRVRLPSNPELPLTYGMITPNTIFDENGKDYTSNYPVSQLWETGAKRFDKNLAKEYFDKAIAEMTDANGNIKGVTPKTVSYKSFDVTYDGKLPLQIIHVSYLTDEQKNMMMVVEANLESIFGKDKFDLIIEPLQFDKYVEELDAFNYDFNLTYGVPEIAEQRIEAFKSPERKYYDTDAEYEEAMRTYTGFIDPTFNKMVDDAILEPTPSAMYQKLGEAEYYYIDNAYVIPADMGGGEMYFTRVKPFTTPFRKAQSFRKLKYAVVGSEDVTKAEYDAEKAEYDAVVERIRNGEDVPRVANQLDLE